MADVATLYGSDDMPDIVSHKITVSFEGEMGQDVGGVTRDFLATYWQHTLEEWFHCEHIKVPCVLASRTSEAENAFLTAWPRLNPDKDSPTRAEWRLPFVSLSPPICYHRTYGERHGPVALRMTFESKKWQVKTGCLVS